MQKKDWGSSYSLTFFSEAAGCTYLPTGEKETRLISESLSVLLK